FFFFFFLFCFPVSNVRLVAIIALFAHLKIFLFYNTYTSTFFFSLSYEKKGIGGSCFWYYNT
ncbi:hypothetical protein HDV64DRAFT_237598, partial [Trichoderma sp. TUCIM 5745]